MAEIDKWAFQWKTNFNPGPRKQTQEVTLNLKSKKIIHPPLFFDNNFHNLYLINIGIKLAKQLRFYELRKLQNLLPRSALITIYKAFVRSHHLDCGDITYSEVYNASFHHELEMLQYSVCLNIAGAIGGTSKEKPYQELDLESLQLQRRLRNLCFFTRLVEIISLVIFPI